MITAKGGLHAYLDTANISTIEKRISEGDEKAAFTMYAMAYQLAKEIGGMCTVLDGKPDVIILSGELFHNSEFTRQLSRKIEKIAPLAIYADENEVDALAINAIGVMKGEIEVLQYT